MQANNKTKIYQAGLPLTTFSYVGLVNNDTSASFTTQATVVYDPNYATALNANTPVGTYANAIIFTASPAGGPIANYNLTFSAASPVRGLQNGTLTVTKLLRNYGWIIPNPSIIYGTGLSGSRGGSSGQLTALSTAPGTQLTAANSIAMDTIRYYTNANLAAAAEVVPGQILTAGPYTLYAQLTPSDANFDTQVLQGTLTVTKRDLKVTGYNKSKPYNTANPALTITYGNTGDANVSGFIAGEGAGNLTTAPVPSTTAALNSNGELIRLFRTARRTASRPITTSFTPMGR